ATRALAQRLTNNYNWFVGRTAALNNILAHLNCAEKTKCILTLMRLVRTERAMARWMCGVTLKDRKSSRDLLDRLGVEDVVRRGRVLWFGHVERKSPDDWVKMCRDLVVESAGGKGRGKKTW